MDAKACGSRAQFSSRTSGDNEIRDTKRIKVAALAHSPPRRGVGASGIMAQQSAGADRTLLSASLRCATMLCNLHPVLSHRRATVRYLQRSGAAHGWVYLCAACFAKVPARQVTRLERLTLEGEYIGQPLWSFTGESLTP